MVKNTGRRAGKESVQLYVSTPNSTLTKELKAFAKTRLLKSGESQTLTMTISRQDLASWDTATHRWATASGAYTLLIGASATDIKCKTKLNIQ